MHKVSCKASTYTRRTVCMYPYCAHSLGPIGMNLGMDTPWRWHGIGKVALHLSHYEVHIASNELTFFVVVAFLCVSEHFESIETLFFLKSNEREVRTCLSSKMRAQRLRERSDWECDCKAWEQKCKRKTRVDLQGKPKKAQRHSQG